MEAPPGEDGGLRYPTRAKAIKTFDPQGDDQNSQLALVAGDMINVFQKDSSGWWAGYKEGRNITGWFPAAAVRELDLEDQSSRNQSALPQTSRASVSSSCSAWSASSISFTGSRSTRGAQPVQRSISNCSALSPRNSLDTSRKASALTTADGRPIASPLAKHDGRRFTTPLPSNDTEKAEKVVEKVVEKDTRKQVPASPAPSRNTRNKTCGNTPQTARVGTPLSRRATSPTSTKAPKPSPSPGPRRGTFRQGTPITARPATQKSLASSPGGGSPLTGSGQLSQLRQASRRLAAPLGGRDAQAARSQSMNLRRNSASKPLAEEPAAPTRCSDGGTGGTTIQVQHELLLEAVRAAAERKTEDAEQEAQALRHRLCKMEEMLVQVQSEMRGKETRITSLESAQADLCLRRRSNSDADGVAPSVQDLIATFEERSTGRIIPSARRSLPPPQSSTLL